MAGNNPDKAKQLSFLKRHAYDINFQIDPQQYRLAEKLGSGAFGIVCAATGVTSGERVAIKKIPEALGSTVVMKRTYREICILRHFSHPNIICVRNLLLPHGVPQAEARDLYVVFDYMATDLHRVIASNQQLGEDHIRYLMYQLFCGLKYIHSADVIHRDLKPANLLVNSDCQLKIGDFGMSRALSDTADVSQRYKLTQYVMTRWYRAPELLMGQLAYCTAVDMWSCGCILAELLTRQPLFPGTSEVDQFSRVVDCMGTPPETFMEKILPYFMKAMIRSYGVKQARPLADLVPQGSRKALDLLNQLLQYEPERRVTSVKVVTHPFLNKYRRPQHEPVCPSKLDFSFDDMLVGEESSARYRLALLRELQALQHPHMSDHDYTQLTNRSEEEALKRQLNACDSSEPPLLPCEASGSKQLGGTSVRVITAPPENDVAMVSAPSSAAKAAHDGDPLVKAVLAAGLSEASVVELAESLAPLLAAQKAPGRCPGVAKRKGGTNWPPQKAKKKISAETNRQLKQLLHAKTEAGATEGACGTSGRKGRAQRRRPRKAAKAKEEAPETAPREALGESEENRRLLQRWEDLRFKYKGPPDLGAGPSGANIALPLPTVKNAPPAAPYSADSLERLLEDPEGTAPAPPAVDVAVLAAQRLEEGQEDVQALSAHLDGALQLFEGPPPPLAQTPRGSGAAYGINCDLQELVNGEMTSFVAQLKSPDHDPSGADNDVMEVWQQLCPVNFEDLYGDLGFPEAPSSTDPVQLLSPSK